MAEDWPRGAVQYTTREFPREYFSVCVCPMCIRNGRSAVEKFTIEDGGQFVRSDEPWFFIFPNYWDAYAFELKHRRAKDE